MRNYPLSVSTISRRNPKQNVLWESPDFHIIFAFLYCFGQQPHIIQTTFAMAKSDNGGGKLQWHTFKGACLNTSSFSTQTPIEKKHKT